MRLRRTTDLRKILRIDALAFPGDDPADVLNKHTAWWAFGELAFCGIRRTSEPGLAFMVRAGVIPVARGLGLQRRMIYTRLRWAKAQGFTNVCTYTVPDNTPSANNLIRCGFRLYDPPERWAGPMLYWHREIKP